MSLDVLPQVVPFVKGLLADKTSEKSAIFLRNVGSSTISDRVVEHNARRR